MQAAAAGGAPALAALLRAAPRETRSSSTARMLLQCFLLAFLVQKKAFARHSSSTVPLIEKFWERVMQFPMALADTVEALQECEALSDLDPNQELERHMVGIALGMHLGSMSLKKADGLPKMQTPWSLLAGSASLQDYSMAAVEAAVQSAEPPEQAIMEGFYSFLDAGTIAGKVSDARLNILVTHAGVLEPLRAAAEGRCKFEDLTTYAKLLEGAWVHLGMQPGAITGTKEAHEAAGGVIRAALRQGAALLQITGLPPAQRHRGARRALKRGFLQVHSQQQLGVLFLVI